MNVGIKIDDNGENSNSHAPSITLLSSLIVMCIQMICSSSTPQASRLPPQKLSFRNHNLEWNSQLDSCDYYFRHYF